MDISELGKYKNQIVSIGIILLAFLIAKNIHSKQNMQIQSLRQQMDSESQKSGVLEDIAQLEKKFQPYKDLLNVKDTATVINTMSNLARQNNLKIISIRPDQEKIMKDYVAFPFNLSISSPSYHSLGKFISDLENCKEVYAIDALAITTHNYAEGLTANLKVSLVSYKE